VSGGLVRLKLALVTEQDGGGRFATHAYGIGYATAHPWVNA
jgi:hypothetical protein